MSEQFYNGPESSFVAIEFAPLKSPLSVKPGAFVELNTYCNISYVAEHIGCLWLTTS
jgi:hypothetical protein